MTDHTTPGIGHNDPPPFDQEEYAALERQIEHFNDAAAEFLALGHIESNDQAARLNDFLTGARGLAKKVDESRKAQKAPWDEKVKAVQSAYKTLVDRIERIKTAPQKMQAEWLKEQKRRAEAEKAERIRKLEEERQKIADEAAKAQARFDSAAQADVEARLAQVEKEEKRLARSKPRAHAESATGGARRQGLRKIKRGKIVSPQRVLTFYRKDPVILEALQKCVDRDVRSRDVDETTIPGIEIYEEETLS